MKSEFYIAIDTFGEPELKKVKGTMATVKTVDGPIKIGFRYAHCGNKSLGTDYIDDILCTGTELETGVIIGKSNNVVNCAKKIKENIEKPVFRSRMKSPLAKKLKDLIKAETEREGTL